MSHISGNTVRFTGNGGADIFDENTGRLKVWADGGEGNDAIWAGR